MLTNGCSVSAITASFLSLDGDPTMTTTNDDDGLVTCGPPHFPSLCASKAATAQSRVATSCLPLLAS